MCFDIHLVHSIFSLSALTQNKVNSGLWDVPLYQRHLNFFPSYWHASMRPPKLVYLQPSTLKSKCWRDTVSTDSAVKLCRDMGHTLELQTWAVKLIACTSSTLCEMCSLTVSESFGREQFWRWISDLANSSVCPYAKLRFEIPRTTTNELITQDNELNDSVSHLSCFSAVIKFFFRMHLPKLFFLNFVCTCWFRYRHF